MTAGSERSKAEQPVVEQRNLLLRSLPSAEYESLLPHLERVDVAPMQVLTAAGQWLSHVYFPETALIAMLRRMRDGTVIEAGIAGRDGMAGIPMLAGVTWSPTTLVAQLPGVCQRMSAAVLHELLPELPSFTALLDRYVLAFMDQLGQTIACNSMHSVEQRCTRWLLTAHDAAGRDDFNLTHEGLAEMLGVRRAGVTVAALALQRGGLIRYSRGRVTILDRRGLEAVACECHAITRAHAERLLGELVDTGSRRNGGATEPSPPLL
jgi:CRP-like cAMP-binding protein